MYKYLVCRLDAIRPAGTIRNSNHFPMVVKSNYPRTVEQILDKALDSISDGYRPNYEYLIVSLDDSKVIRLRPPKPQFEYEIRDF